MRLANLKECEIGQEIALSARVSAGRAWRSGVGVSAVEHGGLACHDDHPRRRRRGYVIRYPA